MKQRKGIKKFVFAWGVLLLLAVSSPQVSAMETGSDTASEVLAEEIYAEQYQASGADGLMEAVPESAEETLERLGISQADWSALRELSAESVGRELSATAGEAAKYPIQAAACIVGILLLCALLTGLDNGTRFTGGVINLIGTLSVCTALIYPISACMTEAARLVEGASVFILACVPVLTGLLAAGGQPTAAASYSFWMLGAGNLISVFSAVILLPLLHVFLTFSLVSGISPQIRLQGFCDLFSKVIKWVLGLTTTVFSAVLGMQTLVTSTADVTGTRAVRFMVSSAVPIVGSALGDAAATVQGCVRFLKSGSGAFALLAGGVIFVPILLKCLFWVLTCQVCAGIGDLFSLSALSCILRAAGKTVEILLVILLCCLTVLLVAGVVVVMGGNSA